MCMVKIAVQDTAGKENREDLNDLELISLRGILGAWIEQH
jgi:hypothetical protein